MKFDEFVPNSYELYTNFVRTLYKFACNSLKPRPIVAQTPELRTPCTPACTPARVLVHVLFLHPFLAASEPPLQGVKVLHIGEQPSSCTARAPLYTDGPLPMLCPFSRIPPMRRQAIINGVVVHNHLHP